MKFLLILLLAQAPSITLAMGTGFSIADAPTYPSDFCTEKPGVALPKLCGQK